MLAPTAVYQGRVGPPSANLAVAAANHRGRASVGGVGFGTANAVVSRGEGVFLCGVYRFECFLLQVE